MSILDRGKDWVKWALGVAGYEMHRRRPRPRSGEVPSLWDADHEQLRFLKGVPRPLIFDIGAHVGVTAARYLSLLPNSRIVAFEPFPVSNRLLRERFAHVDAVRVESLALGATCGRRRMNVNRSTATNSLFATDPRANETWNGTDVVETVAGVDVTVETLDRYLEKNPGIERIHLLKIDAQGAEYDILRGAEQAIRAQKVDVIFMEIIVMPTYVGQRHLDEVLALLRSYGFVLHNFYNSCYTNDGRLNQVDAIFTRQELARTN